MPRRPLPRIAVLLLLAVSSAPAIARDEPAPDLAASIARYADEHAFSGTVWVEKDGHTIYQGAFGLAERRFEVPVRLDTKFKIASITKVFTAVLVLQLRDQGKLDLHAPIRKYLTAYEGEGGDRVTINDLLHHTSGIENYDRVTTYEEAVAKGMPAYQLPHTTDELLEEYASGPLVHEVGKTFDYNNGDYVILGKIVESLTGASYDEVLERRILAPLGMSASGMLHQADVVPGLASTYLKVGEAALRNDLPVYGENWYAAGSMYSTAGDLITFAHALFGGRLLAPETLDLMLTPGLDEYGDGLWVSDLKVGDEAHRFAQRPGSIMGANALLLRFLDDGLTIVILSNTSATDIDAFGFFLGRAVLD